MLTTLANSHHPLVIQALSQYTFIITPHRFNSAAIKQRQENDEFMLGEVKCLAQVLSRMKIRNIHLMLLPVVVNWFQFCVHLCLIHIGFWSTITIFYVFGRADLWIYFKSLPSGLCSYVLEFSSMVWVTYKVPKAKFEYASYWVGYKEI